MVGRGRSAVVVLVALATACTDSGSADSSSQSPTGATTANASTSLPPTSAPSSADQIVVNTVASTERSIFYPFDIGPLPPKQQPRRTVQDIVEFMRKSQEFARFFATEADVAEATITVGLITDHSRTPGDTSDDPSFPGYIVEGGHSICFPIGPATTSSVPPASVVPSSIPCSAQFLINADTGEVPMSGERSIP